MYPECEKLAKVAPISNRMGEFLDWLREQGISLVKWQDGVTDIHRLVTAISGKDQGDEPDRGYIPLREDNEHLLARFFDIDLDRVEQERREMLAALSAK